MRRAGASQGHPEHPRGDAVRAAGPDHDRVLRLPSCHQSLCCPTLSATHLSSWVCGYG
ncbi:hypothetical protein BTZ20_1235 [Rhodococcus sp. MTM3W5.2]|nr:hypothetical protein BTZ20_1235 [Rhodococcus sp. MTM3W5.2]